MVFCQNGRIGMGETLWVILCLWAVIGFVKARAPVRILIHCHSRSNFVGALIVFVHALHPGISRVEFKSQQGICFRSTSHAFWFRHLGITLAQASCFRYRNPGADLRNLNPPLASITSRVMAAMAAVGHRPWRIAAGWALLGFTLIDGSAALSVWKLHRQRRITWIWEGCTSLATGV